MKSTSLHTVMVLLEAKPGKERVLKKLLTQVAEQSRKESHNLGYQVYQDKNKPTQFGLYEQWESAEKHQEQFEKSYILEFAEQAEGLLLRPYEAIFGEEVHS